MEKIWTCKIGGCKASDLPDGANKPMRIAVQRAYRRITGKSPIFTFSGWGGELTDIEREVVEEVNNE